MGKKIIMLLCMLFAVNAYAQESDGVKRFIEEYSTGGIMSSQDPNSKQIGTALPAFNFNAQLNSSALKGKVMVFDFWATWCSGCLVVSQGLDSLMVKESDVYKDVQIIGVNTKEKMIDKGYNAKEYWRKTAKAFPMIDGPSADAFGVAVNNGFPTIILVDDKGIIRRRWDGAGPSTAGAVRLASWQYAVLPKLQGIPVNVDNSKKLMNKKDWISALYFLQSLPDSYDSVSVMKFDAMLHLSETKAAAYLTTLTDKLKDNPEYAKLTAKIVDVILQSETKDENLILSGIKIYDTLRRKPESANSYSFWEKYAELNWRYAGYQKQIAIRRAEQAFNMAQGKAENSVIETMKKKIEKYKKN